MKTLDSPPRTSLLAGLACSLLLLMPVLEAPAAGSQSSASDPCPVPPDSRPVSTTGTLSRGCVDCWGQFVILPDPGFEGWGIASDCSIQADWVSLLGRHVHVEGITVSIRGGIGGTLGAALAVARIEIVTPAERTTWGRVRSLYR